MAAIVGLPVLEVCCYGSDLPLDEKAIPRSYYPYRTTSVIVQTVLEAYRLLLQQVKEGKREPVFVAEEA